MTEIIIFYIFAANIFSMTNISRATENLFYKKLKPNKVLVLLGARRVGKSYLIKKIRDQYKEKVLYLNGDDLDSHALLEKRNIENYKQILAGVTLLIIDEAQEIPEIGKKLKLMIDEIIGLKIIITGSSAFDINNRIGEPLVGRMTILNLYPISQHELLKHETFLETRSRLEERLIYGSYPELLSLKSHDDKIEYIRNLIHSYLLKDILAYEGIKKSDKIIALLQKLAFRVGSEISVDSLGRELQISKNTVDKYLDLFSKVFIVFSVSGFSRNRDNEITKMKKWYFMDNGIRNGLILNYSPLSLRTDVGALWENYLQAERVKYLSHIEYFPHQYFWRTHSKQEVDRIEIYNDKISAFEYKWQEVKVKIPPQFLNAYPEASFEVINTENYLKFISD